MKYRKLRIAWSVTGGVVCLLLIALWVRSYRWWDEVLYHPDPGRIYEMNVREGFLSVAKRSTLDFPSLRIGWSGHTFSAERFAVEKDVEDTLPSQSGWTIVFPGFRRLGQYYLQVPFWFVALITGTLTAAPWFPWRYRLRTLLIGMTMAAIGPGLAVYLLK